MNIFTVGLPNSCSGCGVVVEPEQGWYAESLDHARAGQGLCKTCAENTGKIPAELPPLPAEPEDQVTEPDAEPAQPVKPTRRRTQ